MIYFITVNYYSSNLIAQLIQSIPINQGAASQIIIINNSADDTAIAQFNKDNIIVLESGENLGFGRACNLGLSWIYNQDSQALVWIINPDAYLLDNELEKVLDFFIKHPEVSILGTLVYTLKGQVWFAGGQFFPKTGAILSDTNLLPESLDKDYLESDWVSGCSLLLNLRNFPDCPQFDSEYFLYYEDFDFCRRYAEQGHLIGITAKFGVIHQVSSITNQNQTAKFKHSTYSYLLTLERYTDKWVLLGRLTRMILHALILMPVKPTLAFGKLHGVWLYARRLIQPCRTLSC